MTSNIYPPICTNMIGVMSLSP